MTGKMRFRKQEHSGHAARMREFVPHAFANNAQFEIIYDLFADAANRRLRLEATLPSSLLRQPAIQCLRS